MAMESTTTLVGYRPEINYLLVGPAGCGKSTFLERITLGTIGANSFRVPNTPYVLTNSAQDNAPVLNFYENEILDAEEKRMKPDVVILCFDIANRTAFDELGDINRDVGKTFGGDQPRVVLGLKRDLRHSTPTEEVIDPMLAYKVAQVMESDAYMECSAVTEELIPAVVEDLVRKGLDVKRGKMDGENGISGMGNCTVM